MHSALHVLLKRTFGYIVDRKYLIVLVSVTNGVMILNGGEMGGQHGNLYSAQDARSAHSHDTFHVRL